MASSPDPGRQTTSASQETSCASCLRSAEGPHAFCGPCLAIGRRIAYCKQSCQTSHWKSHKPTCGKPDIPADFIPTATLLRHVAALATTQKASSRPLDFLYYPVVENDTSPPPKPIVLPVSSQKIFAALSKTATTTGNQLSVNLMYSLLLEAVEAQGGTEARLIAQLSEEYGFDLAQALEQEEDPSEAELRIAVGGSAGMELLLEWQMAEAERTR